MVKHAIKMALAGVALLGSMGGTAAAGGCVAPKPASDLSGPEVQAIYDCIRDSMIKGYQKGGDEVAMAYTGWKAASKLPAAPGWHGERFLMTFVNDIGYATYTEFNDEDAKMPVGTVVAKESFKINKKLQVKRGPLFIMTKVGDAEAPDTGGWIYGGILPNGKKMKFKQSFCHDCHGNWDTQDSLGYPLEEVRVSN